MRGTYSDQRFKRTDGVVTGREQEVLERVHREGTCGEYSELKAALLPLSGWSHVGIPPQQTAPPTHVAPATETSPHAPSQ